MKAFRLMGPPSSNRNSFGLRSCILVAEDGETWEVKSNDLNLPKLKDIFVVGLEENELVPTGGGLHTAGIATRDWSVFGFEIPRRLPNAPQSIVNVAWKGTA